MTTTFDGQVLTGEDPQAWRWISDPASGELMRAWPKSRILLATRDGTPPSLDLVTCKAAELIDRLDNLPTEYHHVAQRWSEAKRVLERKRSRAYLDLASFRDPETGKAPAKWVIDAKVAVACEDELDTFAIVDAERDTLDVLHKVLPELRALIQTISATQRDADMTPRRNYR